MRFNFCLGILVSFSSERVLLLYSTYFATSKSPSSSKQSKNLDGVVVELPIRKSKFIEINKFADYSNMPKK